MADNSDNRVRNWATILYPESAIDDWLDVLNDLHIQTLVSPLHDQDRWTVEDEKKDPEHVAGTLKKPHYHILLMFDGKKSYNQVLTLVDTIGSVGAIPVHSKSGYAAYLTHKFEEDKVHYDENAVLCLNGASYNATIADSAEFKNVVIAEMIDWCEANNITSYSYLLKYARWEKPDWFHVLNHSSSNQMLAYLKSKEWENKKKIEEAKEKNNYIY